ncbi:hypothetical protein KP509_01G044700 [Ceratopteris richardii]|nr:hypothetical protein KP509_01G044700 [Ceratopteris richardii]
MNSHDYAAVESPQELSTASIQEQIVEGHVYDEYDEEDAAFEAEAEAFVRKCDVHEIAVRRLIEDLVEDDEEEASAKRSSSACVAGMNDSPMCEVLNSGTEQDIHDQCEIPDKINSFNSPKLNVGNIKSETPNVAGNSGSEEDESMPALVQHSQQQSSGHLSPSGVYRSSQKFGYLVSRKRIQAMKEGSQRKYSSLAPSLSKLPNSPNSTCVKKIASKSNNMFSVSKRLTQEVNKAQCLSDDEISRGKLKEIHSAGKPSGVYNGQRGVIDDESLPSNEHHSGHLGRQNLNSGHSLFKLAKRVIASGGKPRKALDYAARAARAFEATANDKPNLELVTCLHVLAALHCSLGQYIEAVEVLEKSLKHLKSKTGGQEQALVAFAGYMQLGDTLALVGKSEESLAAYCTGLEVQIEALGEKDFCIGETCRYLAEAHAQALQFDKAESLCQRALDIHRENGVPASIEEAADRRLLGLIYNGKGQHEIALEQLVLASMVLISNGRAVEVAAVDASIGDTYALLGRINEAVFSYQKALKVLKASKGELHVAVASLYISLAQLCHKTGKLKESRVYCESALKIYTKQGSGRFLEEVASGLTEISIIYEALHESELALSFLKKALTILETAPGQQSAVAGVEAQIGVFHYLHGDYADAREYFGKAICKLRTSAERNSPLFGIVLNQMGLACVQLSDIQAAVGIFEESRTVLETICGPHHPDTLSVYSNLAGAYDALGR